MDIQTSAARDLQDGGWKELAVRRDNNGIRGKLAQTINELRITRPFWLRDLQSMSQRLNLDGWRPNLQPSTHRFVGLRNDEDDIPARILSETAEDHPGKLRRTQKDDPGANRNAHGERRWSPPANSESRRRNG